MENSDDTGLPSSQNSNNFSSGFAELPDLQLKTEGKKNNVMLEARGGSDEEGALERWGET